MVDLTNVESLADREVKAGGVKLTASSVLAIIAFLSTVVGGLYGGFTLYQKIAKKVGLKHYVR